MNSTQATLEESKFESNAARRSQIGESSTRNSTLVSWCSGYEGESSVSIADYQTGESYAKFPGVKLFKPAEFSTWTHVKEIPETNHLITAYYSRYNSASFKIIDFSTKTIKTVFSFEELEGIVGDSEIAVNAKRKLMALIPLVGKTAYHLLDTDSFTLLRKASWFPQFSENRVSTLDISPDGRKIAMAAHAGTTCVISDISTSNCDVEYNLVNQNYTNIRCRWGEHPEDPSLFLTYSGKLLNILDIEKKNLLLKDSLVLGDLIGITWIDKCPQDSNLLALGGNTVTIFDRRESKFAKSFLPLLCWGGINCVRWSPDGHFIAATSDHSYGKVLDLRTEKMIFDQKTSDKGWAYSVCFL